MLLFQFPVRMILLMVGKTTEFPIFHNKDSNPLQLWRRVFFIELQAHFHRWVTCTQILSVHMVYDWWKPRGPDAFFPWWFLTAFFSPALNVPQKNSQVLRLFKFGPGEMQFIIASKPHDFLTVLLKHNTL